jgi:translocation and assembly module TamA
MSALVSPELSFQDQVFGYVRVQLDGSVYVELMDALTLAGRVRLGAIPGAGREDIAPSRRFYAGGGGSVRGYSYQSIGPRDANNDPIGGRSLVEMAVEARYRFGDFGVVPFLDAGAIYTDLYPDFSNLRFGAGLGVRYYSSFGPIRVDVGTPINPQPGDPVIAVYVSLGQAF